MIRAGHVALLLAFMGAAAEGQTTRPAAHVTGSAAAPTTAPAEVDRTALNDALAALAAGDNAKVLADIRAFQSHLATKGMNINPDWINSNHVLAVALMKSGDYVKAKAPMEFVMRGGKSNRSTVLNLAVLDILGKQNSPRAVNNLRTYTLAHSDDEVAVNLFGMALNVAAQAYPKTDFSGQRSDFDKANARLEQTKPGMRHWGDRWLTKDEFDKMDDTRRLAQKHVDVKASALKQQTMTLNQLQAQYQEKTTPVINISAADAAQRKNEADLLARRIDRQQIVVTSAADQLQTVLRELPQPDWSMKVEPVEIEVVN